MKTLIYIFLFIVTENTFAQRIKLDIGVIATHFTYELKDKNYNITCLEDSVFNIPLHDKKDFNRVVIRPQLGMSYQKELSNNRFYQIGAFFGKDCLYGNTFGAIIDYGYIWKYFAISATFGGYIRNKSRWDRNGYKSTTIVPIVGLNATFKKEFNHIGIELSNRITPILITHNISITYKL